MQKTPKIRSLFLLSFCFIIYSSILSFQAYHTDFPSFFVLKNSVVGAFLSKDAQSQLKYKDKIQSLSQKKDHVEIEVLRDNQKIHSSILIKKLSGYDFFNFVILPSLCALLYFLSALLFYKSPIVFSQKEKLSSFLLLVSIYLSLIFPFHFAPFTSGFFLASFSFSSLLLMQLAFSLHENQLSSRKDVALGIGVIIAIAYFISFNFNSKWWSAFELLSVLYASLAYFYCLYQLKVKGDSSYKNFEFYFSKFLFWGMLLAFIFPFIIFLAAAFGGKNIDLHYLIPLTLILPLTLFLSTLFASLKDYQQKLVQAEKLALLGKLFTGITHEINNPLNFISANLDCLKEYFHFLKLKPSLLFKNEWKEEKVWNESEQIINEMSEGCRRIENIVQHFKKMNHSELKTVSEFKALPLILEAIKYLSVQYPKLPQNCKIDINENVTLHFQPSLFLEMMMNIISNSLHSLADLNTSEQIIIKHEIDTNMDVISIEDFGKGMSDVELKECTESFFTTKNNPEGLGLGLSLVKNWLNQYQGKLKIESQLGKGTKIWIYLNR